MKGRQNFAANANEHIQSTSSDLGTKRMLETDRAEQAQLTKRAKSIANPDVTDTQMTDESAVSVTTNSTMTMSLEDLEAYLFEEVAQPHPTPTTRSREKLTLLSQFSHQAKQSFGSREMTVIGEMTEAIRAANPNAARPFNFHPYQLQGIQKLHELRGGLLADAMGLGKSKVLIALIRICLAARADEKLSALILLPNAVLKQWELELIECGVDPVNIVRKKKRVHNIKQHNYILTSFGGINERLKNDRNFRRLLGVVPDDNQAEIASYVNILNKRCANVEKNYLQFISNKSTTPQAQATITYYFSNMPPEQHLLIIYKAQRSQSESTKLKIRTNIIRNIVFSSLRERGMLSKNNIILTKGIDILLDEIDKINTERHLTNYLPQDDLFFDNLKAEFRTAYQQFKIGIMVGDEATAIASLSSVKRKPVLAISKALRNRGYAFNDTLASCQMGSVILATATPSPNSFEELLALQYVISPHVYLDPKIAIINYNKMINRIQDDIRAYVNCPNPEISAQLRTNLDNSFFELSRLFALQMQHQLKRNVDDHDVASYINLPTPVHLTHHYKFSPIQIQFATAISKNAKAICHNYEVGTQSLNSSESDSDFYGVLQQPKLRGITILDKLSKNTFHPLFVDPDFAQFFNGRKNHGMTYVDLRNVVNSYISKYFAESASPYQDFIQQSSELATIMGLIQTILENEKYQTVKPKLVIFSESVRFQLLIKMMYDLVYKDVFQTDEYQIYCGETDQKERNDISSKFNDLKSNLSVMGLTDAGALGLRLPAGNHIIISPLWGSDKKLQSIARIFRQGNINSHVFIHEVKSVDNVVVAKKDSFSNYKELCNQFYYNHGTRTKFDFLKIVLLDMVKRESDFVKRKQLYDSYDHLVAITGGTPMNGAKSETSTFSSAPQSQCSTSSSITVQGRLPSAAFFAATSQATSLRVSQPTPVATRAPVRRNATPGMFFATNSTGETIEVNITSLFASNPGPAFGE